MRARTTRRRTVTVLCVGLLAAGGGTLPAPAAVAAPAPPYYYDCAGTSEDQHSGTLVGEGCAKVFEITEGDGVYIEDRAGRNDWHCDRVDDVGTSAVRGQGCRAAPKGSW
ncbi:hypothetical protein C3492_20350 [Streptomyces sp. Ru62]|uniref:hypothetical protein n=1 Tax=Streptomyces sp. Ru62 TaxID=2080745 RepID=UPI000CDD9CF6|nr:hypothetical protein [Streptomyces sp. Ru62]POX61662.1 hypothetical protein C3492_20350 [Streptomyces sp. Ru62]